MASVRSSVSPVSGRDDLKIRAIFNSTAKKRALRRKEQRDMKAGRVMWAAVLTVGAFFISVKIVEARREAAEEGRLKAVDTLPTGVLSAWSSHLARQVQTAIRPDGSIIWVRAQGDFLDDRMTAVSRNMPYSFYCAPVIGAEVQFGVGPETINVPIFGALRFERNAERPPDLGVHPQSIAAERLYRELCTALPQMVSERLAATSDLPSSPIPPPRVPSSPSLPSP